MAKPMKYAKGRVPWVTGSPDHGKLVITAKDMFRYTPGKVTLVKKSELASTTRA